MLELELGERGWTTLHVTAIPDDLRSPQSALRKLIPAIQQTGAEIPAYLARLAQPTAEAVAGQTDPAASVDARRLALEACRLLDAVAADAPLTIMLDDAHWWDRGTHRLIAALMAVRESRRWTLVAAARTGEPRARVPQLPREVRRFELTPLSKSATEAVVGDVSRRRHMPRSLRIAIAGRSGGNPFFAIELARQAMADRTRDTRSPQPSRVPARIVELLTARLSACSRAARQLLPLAALAGDAATYELLIGIGAATASELTSHDVVCALDELVAADLLVEEPYGVRLVHPLLRDAALARMNPVRRGALHALIAEALGRLGAGSGGLWEEAAARHRLAAFESGRLREMAAAAARSGFAAGHRARELAAREAAVELLRGGTSAFDVLDDEERAALRGAAVTAAAELGDCSLDGEDDAGAAAAYRWGLTLAETDEERGRLWSALGGIAYRHGDMAGAAVSYERGLAALTGKGDRTGRARLLSDLGWARQRQGRYRESLPLYEKALPLLKAANDHTYLAWTLDRMGIAMVSDGRPQDALAASDAAFETAARAGMRAQLAALHIHRADALEASGQLSDALAQCREAVRVSSESGDRYVRSVAHWRCADILAALGDVEEALRERDAELGILADLDNPRSLAGAQLHRAQLLLRLGRDHEAMQAAHISREAARRVADPHLSKRIGSGVAEVEQSLRASRPTRVPA